MAEELKILAELGVATLALIAVIIFARAVSNRSKSDTSVIKVFADLVSNSIKDMGEGIATHGNESTARHGEIVLALQAVNASLIMLIDNDNKILQSVEEAKQTGEQIMDTVNPIANLIQGLRDDIQQLKSSIDAHLISSNEFREGVIEQTTQIETRLGQVEKRVTQEVEQITPTEAPTNITKLHSVSTKPKIETKEDES